MGPYDLTSSRFFAEPGPVLTRMRVEAPVCFHEGLGAWVLTRYADVSQVLRDVRFVADRGEAERACPMDRGAWGPGRVRGTSGGGWMILPEVPRHSRLRDRAASAFSEARARAMSAMVEATAHDLIDAIEQSAEVVDLMPALATPLPIRVASALLGVPEVDVERVEAWSRDQLAFFGACDADDDLERRARTSAAHMRAYFEAQLERRQRDGGADLLVSLVRAERAEPTLETGDLALLAATLANGAFTMSTHLIAHAVLAMLTHPFEWGCLKDDPRLAAAAVEETLRSSGPMLMIDRFAREEAEIGGVRIAAGERVACVLHAANNDPEVFERPERFDLGRSPNPHLAFGVGPRFCVGANLARLEAEIVLRVLAERTPHMHLTGAAPRIGNQIMRGFTHLPVRVRPRTRKAAPLGALADELARNAARTRSPQTLLTDRDPDIHGARPIDNH